MEKQAIAYPYNGVLFSHREDHSADIGHKQITLQQVENEKSQAQKVGII